jgi:truncated hemoglobin YjbI
MRTSDSSEPTVYEWAGGYPALLRTTKLFYDTHVPSDELLAPLFANMSPDHPERVASWLSEVFGGPSLYSDEYGDYNSMVAHHLMKHLTEEQRARWVALLVHSANEAGLPNDAEFRAAFVSYLEWGSRLAVENSQPGAEPPANMPVPKWNWVAGATPWARVSAVPSSAAEQLVAAGPAAGPAAVGLPGRDEMVSFEIHVRPLFREKDRSSMRRVFDLWSHADVCAHADAIARRLREGTMPCDGAWPRDHVEVFERWVAEGRSA